MSWCRRQPLLLGWAIPGLRVSKWKKRRWRPLLANSGVKMALNAQSVGEIDAAFATIVQSRAGALLIGNSILFNNRRRQVPALAARHAVPAIGSIREFVMAGGLLSYGASDSDAYRRAGAQYVARILKDAKPADLPVLQPTKFEFVINLKNDDPARQAIADRSRRPC